MNTINIPPAIGVGRIADNQDVVEVCFSRPLTDDELRELHEVLAGRSINDPRDRYAASTLRSIMHGWHERAVALGTDGVEDVIHLAEVRKRRGDIRIAHDATPRPEVPVLEQHDSGAALPLTRDQVDRLRDFMIGQLQAEEFRLQLHQAREANADAVRERVPGPMEAAVAEVVDHALGVGVPAHYESTTTKESDASKAEATRLARSLLDLPPEEVSRGFKRGDILEAHPETPLRSGAEWWPYAIVALANPLVLVSPRGDMRWRDTVPTMKLHKVGVCTPTQLSHCTGRLDEEELAAARLEDAS